MLRAARRDGAPGAAIAGTSALYEWQIDVTTPHQLENSGNTVAVEIVEAQSGAEKIGIVKKINTVRGLTASAAGL